MHYWFAVHYMYVIITAKTERVFYYYIQLLFTVYTVDKTQISVQLQQNTKAIYKSYLSIIVRSYFIIMGHWVTGRYGYADKQCHCHADKPCHMRVS